MINEDKFNEVKDFVIKVGKIACDYFYSGDTKNTLKKDLTVVTQVDKEIEVELVKYIHMNFPDDAIVGEEFGNEKGRSGFVWHLDPIDGTDNFLRKIPFFAISVARLGDDVEGCFGIVHNPITNQTFSSFKETLGGVYENDRLCTLTADPLGGKYVITIGGSSRELWMKPAVYALSEAVGLKYGRGGFYHCIALELAYIAANRIDANLTFGLNSYDYAAGLLLVKATGGAISVFEDGKWQRWNSTLKDLCSQNRTIFSSHPDIHQGILDFIGDPNCWATRHGAPSKV